MFQPPRYSVLLWDRITCPGRDANWLQPVAPLLGPIKVVRLLFATQQQAQEDAVSLFAADQVPFKTIILGGSPRSMNALLSVDGLPDPSMTSVLCISQNAMICMQFVERFIPRGYAPILVTNWPVPPPMPAFFFLFNEQRLEPHPKTETGKLLREIMALWARIKEEENEQHVSELRPDEDSGKDLPSLFVSESVAGGEVDKPPAEDLASVPAAAAAMPEAQRNARVLSVMQAYRGPLIVKPEPFPEFKLRDVIMQLIEIRKDSHRPPAWCDVFNAVRRRNQLGFRHGSTGSLYTFLLLCELQRRNLVVWHEDDRTIELNTSHPQVAVVLLGWKADFDCLYDPQPDLRLLSLLTQESSHLAGATAASVTKNDGGAPVQRLADPSASSTASGSVVISSQVSTSPQTVPSIPVAPSMPRKRDQAEAFGPSVPASAALHAEQKALPQNVLEFLRKPATVLEMHDLYELQEILIREKPPGVVVKTGLVSAPHVLYVLLILYELGYDGCVGSSKLGTVLDAKFRHDRLVHKKAHCLFQTFADNYHLGIQYSSKHNSMQSLKNLGMMVSLPLRDSSSVSWVSLNVRHPTVKMILESSVLQYRNLIPSHLCALGKIVSSSITVASASAASVAASGEPVHGPVILAMPLPTEEVSEEQDAPLIPDPKVDIPRAHPPYILLAFDAVADQISFEFPHFDNAFSNVKHYRPSRVFAVVTYADKVQHTVRIDLNNVVRTLHALLPVPPYAECTDDALRLHEVLMHLTHCGALMEDSAAWRANDSFAGTEHIVHLLMQARKAKDAAPTLPAESGASAQTIGFRGNDGSRNDDQDSNANHGNDRDDDDDGPPLQFIVDVSDS